MKNKISQSLSVLIHPIFMPIVSLKLILYLSPISFLLISPYINFVTNMVVLTTIVLPVFIILLLKLNKKINSFEMKNLKERPLPLLLAGISMLTGYIIIYPIISMFEIIKTTFSCAILIVFLSSLVSRYWKISLHMLGIGGLTGMVLGIHFFIESNMPILIFLLILSGMLGSVRLYLKAHNNLQVYVGFLAGCIVEFAGLFFLI